jgi:hypothetical protein
MTDYYKSVIHQILIRLVQDLTSIGDISWREAAARDIFAGAETKYERPASSKERAGV